MYVVVFVLLCFSEFVVYTISLEIGVFSGSNTPSSYYVS